MYLKEVKSMEEFYPLYRKGDSFIILEKTNDERLLPIKALRLKDKQIYYFNDGELI